MFCLKYSSRFKKDLKRYEQNKKALAELENILDCLLAGKSLPPKNKNHKLLGEFKDCLECHIQSDLLLVYKIEKEEIMILLLRIGSHAEIF